MLPKPRGCDHAEQGRLPMNRIASHLGHSLRIGRQICASVQHGWWRIYPPLSTGATRAGPYRSHPPKTNQRAEKRRDSEPSFNFPTAKDLLTLRHEPPRQCDIFLARVHWLIPRKPGAFRSNDGRQVAHDPCALLQYEERRRCGGTSEDMCGVVGAARVQNDDF